MKIFVPVKRVVDYNVKIRVKAVEPAGRSAGIKVANAAELVSKLKTAGVI